MAVKNRHHGSLNEYAQQRSEVTLEEVLGSRMIADPLTLLQCCPSQVDGAAALVLGNRPGPHGRDVRVLGSIVVSGLREGARDDILDAEITALKKAGVACEAKSEQRWGTLTRIRMPGGGTLGLYQPKHPRP